MAVTLSLLVSFILFGSSFASIPEATCSLSDPDFDTCLEQSLNKLVPQLANEGIPEVQLAPLDPLLIKKLHLVASGAELRGDLWVKDIVVKGLLKTSISSLSSDFKEPVNQTLEMSVANPELLISGKYAGSLRFENMPIFGDGDFQLTLKDVSTEGKLVADTRKGEDGKLYFIVKSVTVEPDLGDFQINATHLFNGNEIMSRITLNWLNTNWRAFFELSLPTVVAFLNTFIKDQINVFTEQVSVDRIVRP